MGNFKTIVLEKTFVTGKIKKKKNGLFWKIKLRDIGELARFPSRMTGALVLIQVFFHRVSQNGDPCL